MTYAKQIQNHDTDNALVIAVVASYPGIGLKALMKRTDFSEKKLRIVLDRCDRKIERRQIGTAGRVGAGGNCYYIKYLNDIEDTPVDLIKTVCKHSLVGRSTSTPQPANPWAR